jgi:hypothetical protein
MVSVPGQKRVWILRLEKPVFLACRHLTRRWPQTILSGHVGVIITLSGIGKIPSLRQRLAIIQPPIRFSSRRRFLRQVAKSGLARSATALFGRSLFANAAEPLAALLDASFQLI